MKWIENGITFEGTVEEFKALHAQAEDRHEVPVPPAEEKPLRRERTGLPVECVQRGGESLLFKSINAAFRWYAEDQGPSRTLSAVDFRKKLTEGGSVYTGGHVFALSAPKE